jgi:hypothetical protein
MLEKADVHDHSRVLTIFSDVLPTSGSWPKLATEFMHSGSLKAVFKP